MGDLVEYFTGHPRAGDDLIQGIYDPSLSAILGPPTVGKSRFKRQTIAALVGGTNFLGRAIRDGKHRVVSYNTDPGTVHRETMALQELLAPSLWGDVFVTYAKPPHDDAFWDRQVELCVAQGVTVACYDNVFGGLAGTGDVNDSAAVIPILNRLTAFGTAGIAAIMVCHTNANDTMRIIGSTAAEARTRAKIHIKNSGTGHKRLVTVTGNDLEPTEFSIRTTALGIELVEQSGKKPLNTRAQRQEDIRNAITGAATKADAIKQMVAASTHDNKDSARKALDRMLAKEPGLWADKSSDSHVDGRTLVPPIPPSKVSVQMSAGPTASGP